MRGAQQGGLKERDLVQGEMQSFLIMETLFSQTLKCYQHYLSGMSTLSSECHSLNPLSQGDVLYQLEVPMPRLLNLHYHLFIELRLRGDRLTSLCL